MPFSRPQAAVLARRLREPRRFLMAVVGPRQSPKLQVLNTALMTAQTGLTLKEVRRDGAFWGRVVE